ncbi:TPA: SpaA isopeptide-forming pilin-related protein [Listeria monocytogenes]|uniref:SpaA isopeptide-forming pilin-related protein n=1 Tax=Listeria monocytogenes TaxID=1639 RepID=UPI00085CABD4|nr:SpaA isopeptide-forming pilin-related protein [Listeria monocytogenes]MCZ93475.1 LPXTG cell wall anchor domain-containing protein [Listeria monocytogenes serotype 3c]EAG6760968.1 LPXTG cell wall anchor domain-containing protein [Listeria monocytogenes]EAH4220587.1 LPXTG cell wall anchor domain-containing protein [Listeria monocytogenes]EAH4235112.1 LPXTG cell wall anchor domain-containing protein [Listeria monocytogenes]EAH4268383.1 LPXTG cell wall anchor domain-containing protein [Listeria
MSKNGNFLKKVGLAFLSILIVASTIFQTTVVKAATSYGSQFLNTVELLDKDGVPQTDFGYYDNMDVHYTWSIPNSTNVKAGDTMDFTLPSQLALATDLAFDVKDSNGQVVGTATVKRATNQVTLVFSDYVEKHSDIKGELDFWTTFNQKVITGNETVDLEFPLENGTTQIDVKVGEKTPVSPTETLFKYGWVDASNPSLIHWVIRVNYAKVNIPNAVFTDIIGSKQTLNFDSIKAFHGTYSADRIFTAGAAISSTNFSATSDGFSVALGDLTDSVQISYTTTATDGGKSTQYDNTAKLAGTDFVPKQTSTWTPASGGGGEGGGTTGSVTLTKEDAKTKATLEGAEFKLVDSKGTVLQENITTNASGQLSIADLKFDTYQLIETKAPTGYKLDTTPVEFTIGENNQAITVTKENTLNTGSVELTKLDSATKATLAGATFELQDKEGNTLQTGLTTDENGVLKVTDLVPGSYQFIETSAPTGYKLDNSPVSFEIIASETDQIVKVTKENTLEVGSVELTKLDSATKATLAGGATFELQNKEGNTLQTGLTTDENGVLNVTDLVPGTYQFVETKAPIGYELDTTPVVFEIIAGETDQPVKVTKENTLVPPTPVPPTPVPPTPIPPTPLPPVPYEPTVPPTKPAVPVTPKKSENSEDSPKTTQIRITKSLPKTGDTNSFAGLGVILIALSLSGLLLKRK